MRSSASASKSTSGSIPGSATGPGSTTEAMASLKLDDSDEAKSGEGRPEVKLQVPDKHPLTPLGAQYQDRPAAFLKVYDEDASFRPASVLDVVGIVSQGALPTFDNEEGDVPLVPSLHVLKASPLDAAYVSSTSDVSVRQSLVEHLAGAFDPPDLVAGELLLLNLIARPEQGGVALGEAFGQLNLNLVRPRTSFSLASYLSPLVPALVPLPLSLELLHKAPFKPKSDGASLSPGLLQLAPGSLLLIDEDALAEGQLKEQAVRNLQSLSQVLSEQVLTYEYPFSDGVRIGTSIRAIVESEGKSLLRLDATVPCTLRDGEGSELRGEVREEKLGEWRRYLAHMSGVDQGKKFSMPDDVAQLIQDQFVAERQGGSKPSASGGSPAGNANGTSAAGNGEGGSSASTSIEKAQDRLKLRMKIARLLTLSLGGGELTRQIWERAVELESEVERRNVEREASRRQGGGRLGRPTGEMPAEAEPEARSGEGEAKSATGEGAAAREEGKEREVELD